MIAAGAAGAAEWWRPAGVLRTRPIGAMTLLLGVALYLSLASNTAFWRQVLKGLPPGWSWNDAAIVCCLFVALNALLILAMLPFSARALLRPFLCAVLVGAAGCDYFMTSYGTVIDAGMIDSLLQTDRRETLELLNPALLLHVLVFGALPAVVVTRLPVAAQGAVRGLAQRLGLAAMTLAVTSAVLLVNYKTVSLWSREHRVVRLYVNPAYPVYSTFRSLAKGRADRARVPAPLAPDAVRVPSTSGKPRVVVMVVGETARAANFSLLGYSRSTNPAMAKVPGVVAMDLRSCGTATAVSVPCMFSMLGRKRFSRDAARAQENVLDVLQRTGVAVVWRDDNSDCKGVCARVPTEDLRHAEVEGACDRSGCRDEVLLDGLEDRIAAAQGDTLIVLHMLGSHGPSYFRRYPEQFRRFKPECARDEVQDCSRESIINAYDNTLLYTDHVLSRIVAMLQRHEALVEPTMLYVSDHGESLGENGIYLHGLPYAIAPEVQTHVPLVAWASPALHPPKPAAASHDDVAHILLGRFTIRTVVYQVSSDLLHG